MTSQHGGRTHQFLLNAVKELRAQLQVEHFVERDVLSQEPNRRVRFANLRATYKTHSND